MPFTSPVLDDFNRNSAGNGFVALGANWGEYTIGGPWTHDVMCVGQLSGAFPNQLRQAGTSNSSVYNSAYWIPLSATDFEMYLKVTSYPTGSSNGISVGLIGRIQNPGTASAKGTGLSLSMGVNVWTGQVGEWTNNDVNGVRAISGAFGGIAFVANDWIGLRVYERSSSVHFSGTIIEFWTKRAADGNQWVKQVAALDTSPNRITASGPVGLLASPNIGGQQMSWDDFGVAAITAPPTDVGYTARRSSEALLGDQSIPGGMRPGVPDEAYLAEKAWMPPMFGEKAATGVGGGGISIYEVAT